MLKYTPCRNLRELNRSLSERIVYSGFYAHSLGPYYPKVRQYHVEGHGEEHFGIIFYSDRDSFGGGHE